MDANETVVESFRQGALPGAELEAALNEAVAAIAASPPDLAALGLSADQVATIQFEVRETANLDPATILLTIVIGVAVDLGADGIKALLRAAVRRVRRDKGDDAIGDVPTT